MIHEILPVGVLHCNCSIFGDEQTREGIVIDPGDNIPEVLDIIKRHGLTVKAIVITHAHIDHIGGAHKLRAATGAPVYMNENDALLRDMLDVQAGWLGMESPEKVTIDNPVREGDKLLLGTTEFAVLDTPGHTQGSISLWIPSENKLVIRCSATASAAPICPAATATRSCAQSTTNSCHCRTTPS